MKPLFITGIGTDVGKTIASAVLVENLKADYWKPIQSGDLNHSDTSKVSQLVANNISTFHQEAYRLSQPYSPHKSAAIDGIEINLKEITLPSTFNRLIIEGAGGLMVPLNNRSFIVDLIQLLDCEVILVVKHYLGSINHTLLSIELLKSRKIPIKGLIFNGIEDIYSEQAILGYSNLPVLCHVPLLSQLSSVEIKQIADKLSLNL